MSPIANTLTPQERNALQTAVRRLGRPRLAQEIGISVTTLDTAIGASLQQRTREKILVWLRKSNLLPAVAAADAAPAEAPADEAAPAEAAPSPEPPEAEAEPKAAEPAVVSSAEDTSEAPAEAPPSPAIDPRALWALLQGQTPLHAWDQAFLRAVADHTGAGMPGQEAVGVAYEETEGSEGPRPDGIVYPEAASATGEAPAEPAVLNGHAPVAPPPSPRPSAGSP